MQKLVQPDKIRSTRLNQFLYYRAHLSYDKKFYKRKLLNNLPKNLIKQAKELQTSGTAKIIKMYVCNCLGQTSSPGYNQLVLCAQYNDK